MLIYIILCLLIKIINILIILYILKILLHKMGYLPKKWTRLSEIGIDPIHRIIILKVLNFPEISDETPHFPGNLAI